MREASEYCRFSQMMSSGSGAMRRSSGPAPEKKRFSSLSAMHATAESTVSNVTKTWPVGCGSTAATLRTAAWARARRRLARATLSTQRISLECGYEFVLARCHSTCAAWSASRAADRSRAARMRSR